MTASNEKDTNQLLVDNNNNNNNLFPFGKTLLQHFTSIAMPVLILF